MTDPWLTWATDNWTEIGADVVTEDRRTDFLSAVTGLPWVTLPAFIQGLGGLSVRAALNAFDIPATAAAVGPHWITPDGEGLIIGLSTAVQRLYFWVDNTHVYPVIVLPRHDITGRSAN